jgi:hypothetical protein
MDNSNWMASSWTSLLLFLAEEDVKSARFPVVVGSWDQ